MGVDGKRIMLETLDGKVSDRIPVTLFCCGWEYRYKLGDMEKWQMSCGGTKEWMKAYKGVLDYHSPDSIMYDGVSTSNEEAKLISEDDESWVVYHPAIGENRILDKRSGYDRSAVNGGWLSHIKTKEDIIKNAGIHVYSDIYLNCLKELIEYSGNRTLITPAVNPAYWRTCWSLGFERAMTAMMDEPDFFIYLCETYKEDEKIRYRQLKQAGAEAVFISDAWSSTDILSPKMIRKFAMPYHKYTIDAIHEAGMKVMLWNEGDVRAILDDEAALDMDSFGVEQMRKNIKISMGDLRKSFGNDRCIMGNLDSELLFIRGNKDEITEEIHRIIKEAGEGLPFQMFTGSPIPSNVEIDVVQHMFDIMYNL